MTTVKKIELESVFLISIAAILSLFFVVHKNTQELRVSVSAISVNPLLPTPAPLQNAFSQISPDGTKKVVMKIADNKDDSRTYSFYIADSDSGKEQSIFEKNLDVTKSMSIPFNTFSSDNKYFFIQENSKEGKNIFVFKTIGAPFSETEKYIDVTNLFNQRKTGNIFSEATGWASESLIVINTTKEDGTIGPSYWFEIPSKAIIQLSSEF